MDHFSRHFTRRRFVMGLGVTLGSVSALKALGRGFVSGPFSEEAARYVESGDYAQDLVRTPSQTEGPFYPDKMPLDTDNDLLVIGKESSPADGEVTHLSGRILNEKGEAVKNAVVEIWQVDNRGAYLHSMTDNAESRDKRFQGFGRFETALDGKYRFRTIKPVAYPGRTPHIHVKVKKDSRELLTTQCYVKGDPRNERDGIIRSIRDPRARESVIVAFEPVPGSRPGELKAVFDIVVGRTPEQ
jgi:protocatechuate 3,4-dioxygenase beta subunit